MLEIIPETSEKVIEINEIILIRRRSVDFSVVSVSPTKIILLKEIKYVQKFFHGTCR